VTRTLIVWAPGARYLERALSRSKKIHT